MVSRTGNPGRCFPGNRLLQDGYNQLMWWWWGGTLFLVLNITFTQSGWVGSRIHYTVSWSIKIAGQTEQGILLFTNHVIFTVSCSMVGCNTSPECARDSTATSWRRITMVAVCHRQSQRVLGSPQNTLHTMPGSSFWQVFHKIYKVKTSAQMLFNIFLGGM